MLMALIRLVDGQPLMYGLRLHHITQISANTLKTSQYTLEATDLRVCRTSTGS